MSDIERDRFETEMARIFDLPEEVRLKLPSQRTFDEQGTEVYEGWEGDEAARTFSTAWLVWQAARARDAEPVPGELRESVQEAVCEALGEALDCTRVWSAWSVGTMSQNDFQVIAEDPERVAEIADAAIAAIARPPAANQGVPEGWEILPEDFRTHFYDIKDAIQAKANEERDTYQDDNYWAHQLRVMQRIESMLTNPPHSMGDGCNGDPRNGCSHCEPEHGCKPTEGWLHEVKAERKRQDEKWGGPEHDDQHRPDFFVQLIQDYAGWSRVMASRGSLEKFRRRMIQVAALAGAAVEATDRAIERVSGPIETGGECRCGETEETWRICPEHGPTPPQPMEDE